MIARRLTRAGFAACLALGLAACEQDSPAEPMVDLETAKLELAQSFDQLAAAATREGDVERSDALRDAAHAARRGVQPTEIEVKIRNEKVIYKAIVVGVVRESPATGRILVRSLFAWTGQQPRTAVLYVASRTDLGLFGHPGGDPAGEPGPARGMWRDLVNQVRWIAKSGSADLEVASTGPACPAATAADLAITCTLARWDVRVNGVFEPAPDGGETLPIHTNADGVNGIILARAP